jgi:hypothetical protein
MKRFRRSITIAKLLTLALLGAVGLIPIQASAQFNIPIIPPFYLRTPGYQHHSAPSHRSSSQAKHEDNNQSSTEKDATQVEPNASSQNNSDNPPLFVPLR